MSNIDLERNYEIPEAGKKSEEKKKKKGEQINLDKKNEKEDEDEPLPGLSGTRW
jgi:hypothetical protein